MSDLKEVFPTTGAISVRADDEYAVINQESTMGDRDGLVYIPLAVFPAVMKALFEDLPADAVERIQKAAEAELVARGGVARS